MPEEEFTVSLTNVDINNIMLAFNQVVKASSDATIDKNIQARALLQNKFMEAMKPNDNS